MSDRIKNGLLKIIAHYLKPTDYHALYPARVVAQNAAGNLEVVPDDARLPGMTDVPIRFGIPCVRAEIKKGSRVLIGFEGGRPDKPVATVWDSASVDKLIVAPDKLYIGSDGATARPIARMGDMVECYLSVAELAKMILPPTPPTGTMKLPGMIQTGASKGFSA